MMQNRNSHPCLPPPRTDQDGKIASTLIRACVMDLLDPRTLGACLQASVRLHGARSCQIPAAVDLVEQTRHDVYDQRLMQLTKSADKQTSVFASSRSCACIRRLQETARMSARYA
jgi:hypothetical protein